MEAQPLFGSLSTSSFWNFRPYKNTEIKYFLKISIFQDKPF